VVVDPVYWASQVQELRDVLTPLARGVRPEGPPVAASPVTQLRLVLTVEEAAAALGISRASAYEAVRVGEIPSVRIGRRILVPKSALQRMLDSAGESDENGGR
jgi:excisionase family DNA binding protein